MEKLKEVVPAQLRVLVVGNNPIELSRLLDKLKKVDGKRIATEIAFDVTSLLERLQKFVPDHILIDDNIGRPELKKMVTSLLKERKTKNTPITVLKNSNYQEAIATGVMDFMLKEHLSADSLLSTLRNSLKFRQTQLYLYKAYKRRKGQLARLFVREQAAFQI
jgi:CheY-like chemotaxis protein